MTSTDDSRRAWVVFADDWGRHPSSCQHLIGQMLGERDIFWINTIGTRPLRLDWSTVQRVFSKLAQWSRPGGRPAATDRPGPVVLAPKMWPSFRSRWGRSLNRRLLLRSLKPLFSRLPEPPTVITTLPLVADLVGELPVHRWVYYCVDDFSVWPGYDGETMQRLERELVPRMNELIAVSETLVNHLASWNRSAKLLTHGVDLAHWQQRPEPLAELAALPQPLAIFWGVIDRRMDTAFLKALNDRLHQGTIVLIGPQEDPDPALAGLNRVRILPALPYAQLPGVAAAASVLIMPYIDAPVTQAMQPLKLKEYLATGRPVVVRQLPSTTTWSDCLDVAATPEAFANAVIHRLTVGLDDTQQLNRQRLEQESWAGKARLFRNWVEG